jgi:hypothetical protein
MTEARRRPEVVPSDGTFAEETARPPKVRRHSDAAANWEAEFASESDVTERADPLGRGGSVTHAATGSPPIHRRSNPLRSRLVAGAVLAIAVSAGSGWMMARAQLRRAHGMIGSRAAGATDPAPVPSAASPAAPERAGGPGDGVDAGSPVVPPVGTAGPEAGGGPAQPETPPLSGRAGSAGTSPPTEVPGLRPDGAGGTASGAPGPASAGEARPIEEPRIEPPALSVDAPPKSVPTLPFDPAPPPIARESVPSAEPAIRNALAQLAQAYSDLDADAAQRVWPGVNRAALARAFDALAQQQVSLSDCQIDMAGSSAHANCLGITEWTPKVGGGRPKTESRVWDVNLTKGLSGWQISSAHVTTK